jgi:hypothetical protein
MALIGEIAYGAITTPILLYVIAMMFGAMQQVPGISTEILGTGMSMIVLVLGIGEIADIFLLYVTLTSGW